MKATAWRRRCRSTCRAPVGREAPAGIHLAYLTSDNLSYLRDSFGYVPDVVTSDQTLTHGERYSPPLDGLHRLFALHTPALHALVWSARRFGHDGHHAAAEHKQAFAPDGHPMFTGSGTLPVHDPVGKFDNASMASGFYQLRAFAGNGGFATNPTYLVSGGMNSNGDAANMAYSTTSVTATPFFAAGGKDPWLPTVGGAALFREVVLGEKSSKGAPADYTAAGAPGCRAVPFTPPPYYLTDVASADPGYAYAGADLHRIGQTSWCFRDTNDGSGTCTIQNVATCGYLAARAPPAEPVSGLQTALQDGYAPCYPSADGCLASYMKAYLAPLLPGALLKTWTLYKDGSALWIPQVLEGATAAKSGVLFRNKKTAEYLCLVDENPLYGYLTTAASSAGASCSFWPLPLSSTDLPSGILSVDNISLLSDEADEYVAALCQGSLARVGTVPAGAWASKWGPFFVPSRTPPPVPTGDPSYVPPTHDDMLGILGEIDEKLVKRLGNLPDANQRYVHSFVSWASSTVPPPEGLLKPAVSMDYGTFRSAGFTAWLESFGRTYYDAFGTDQKRTEMIRYASGLVNNALHVPKVTYKPLLGPGKDMWSEITSVTQTPSPERGDTFYSSAPNAVGCPGRVRPPGSGWLVEPSTPSTVTVRFAQAVSLGAVYVLLTNADPHVVATYGASTVTVVLKEEDKETGTVVTYPTVIHALDTDTFTPSNVLATDAVPQAYTPPLADFAWVLQEHSITGITKGFGCKVGRLPPGEASNGLLALKAPSTPSAGDVVTLAGGGFADDPRQVWWVREDPDPPSGYYLIMTESPGGDAMSGDTQKRTWLALTLAPQAQKLPGDAQGDVDNLLYLPYKLPDYVKGSGNKVLTLQPAGVSNSSQRWRFVRSPGNTRMLESEALPPFVQSSWDLTGVVNHAYGYIGEGTGDAAEPNVSVTSADVTITVANSVVVSDVVFVAGDPTVAAPAYGTARTDQRVVIPGAPNRWQVLYTTSHQPKPESPPRAAQMYWSPAGIAQLKVIMADPTLNTWGGSTSSLSDFFTSKTQEEWCAYVDSGTKGALGTPPDKTLVSDDKDMAMKGKQYRTQDSAAQACVATDYPFYIAPSRRSSSSPTELPATVAEKLHAVSHNELRRALQSDNEDEEGANDTYMVTIDLDDEGDVTTTPAPAVPPTPVPLPPTTQPTGFVQTGDMRRMGNREAAEHGRAARTGDALVPPGGTSAVSQASEAAAAAGGAASREADIQMVRVQGGESSTAASTIAETSQLRNTLNSATASAVNGNAANPDRSATWASGVRYTPEGADYAPPPLADPNAVAPQGGPEAATVGSENVLNFMTLGIMDLFGSFASLFPSITPSAAAGGGAAAAPPASPAPEAAYAVLYQLTIVTGAIAEAYNAASTMMMRLQNLLQETAAQTGQDSQLNNLFFLSPFTQFLRLSDPTGVTVPQVNTGFVPAGQDFLSAQLNYANALQGRDLGTAATDLLQRPIGYARGQARRFLAANSFLQAVLAQALFHAMAPAPANPGEPAYPPVAPTNTEVQDAMDTVVTAVRANRPLPFPPDWPNQPYTTRPRATVALLDPRRGSRTASGVPLIERFRSLHEMPVDNSAFQITRASATAQAARDYQTQLQGYNNPGAGGAAAAAVQASAPQRAAEVQDLANLPLQELLFAGQGPVVENEQGMLLPQTVVNALFDLMQIGVWFQLNSDPGIFAAAIPGSAASTTPPAAGTTSEQVSQMFASYTGGNTRTQGQQPGGRSTYPPFIENLFRSWGMNVRRNMDRANLRAFPEPTAIFAATGAGHGGMLPQSAASVTGLLTFIAALLAGINPPWASGPRNGGPSRRSLMSAMYIAKLTPQDLLLPEGIQATQAVNPALGAIGNNALSSPAEFSLGPAEIKQFFEWIKAHPSMELLGEQVPDGKNYLKASGTTSPELYLGYKLAGALNPQDPNPDELVVVLADPRDSSTGKLINWIPKGNFLTMQFINELYLTEMPDGSIRLQPDGYVVGPTAVTFPAYVP